MAVSSSAVLNVLPISLFLSHLLLLMISPEVGFN
jgi:hypothetical protein